MEDVTEPPSYVREVVSMTTLTSLMLKMWGFNLILIPHAKYLERHLST